MVSCALVECVLWILILKRKHLLSILSFSVYGISSSFMVSELYIRISSILRCCLCRVRYGNQGCSLLLDIQFAFPHTVRTILSSVYILVSFINQFCSFCSGLLWLFKILCFPVSFSSNCLVLQMSMIFSWGLRWMYKLFWVVWTF